MKKLVILGIAAIALLAASAMAGDYHKGTELVCNQCHVMHYSQTHTYGAGQYQGELGLNGPYEYLLRNDINSLCLSCHDGEATVPDVLGANSGTAVRLAGALNKFDGSVSGYAAQNGHSLGYTSASYPGKGSATFAPDANEGLDCVNCHNPHGSTNYRNLMPAEDRAFSMTYAVNATTPDLTKDVWEKDATHQYVGAAGEDHYDVSNVEYCEPGGTGSKYATMCKTCHADFHGAMGGTEVGGVAVTGGYEEFHRHPASDVNIGALGGGHSTMYRAASGTTPVRGYGSKLYRVKVLSSLGNWGAQGVAMTSPYPADLTPSCMSCHKSHGNQNPFGLVFLSGNNPVTENGDGVYQDLCKQCHGQGY